ncbi:MAG: carbohydrate ABC transporter permease [Clostridiales bacterium]|nr:carbohydrate ABC transporter permease [Clostridiales bacterium]
MIRRRGNRIKFNDMLFHTINYTVFGLFTLMCIYPFYYIFIYSISDSQLASRGIYLLPKGVTLYNYYIVLRNPGIASAALVSLSRTVAGTVLTVFCISLFGYVLTKKELFLRKFIYRFVVMTMYLNPGLIPYYILIQKLGLRNNFLVYILPGAVSAFNLILVKTYIEQIPSSLEEAAMVDGADYFRIFLKIIFPVSMPIIATIAVFTAVGQWNSFSDNLFFVSNPKLQTLQMTLYKVLANVSEVGANVTTEDIRRNIRVVQPTSTTIRMTITMIVTLPILFVYPFLQRYFVKGIMLGAIKG